MANHRNDGGRLTALLGAILILAACAKTQQTSTQRWSTRSDSASSGGGQPMLADSVPPAPDQLSVDPGSLRESSIRLLEQAAGSSNALLRHHAIEMLQPAGERLEPVVRRGLVDENRAVRFAAVMTIGQKKMKDLVHLVEPLVKDESDSVRAAAIFALRSCGKNADLNPLAKFIVSDDPEVRGNTAMVLGEMGDPSAAKLIQNSLGRGMTTVPSARVKIVEMQMAQALVRLGHSESIQAIRAALFSPGEQNEIIAMACLLSGELKDATVVPDLFRLATRGGNYQQAPEVQMAATMAIAQIADGQTPPLEVPLANIKSEEYQRRQQAAITLGWIPKDEALVALQAMLNDSNPVVQVAAAGGIVRLTGRSVGGNGVAAATDRY